MATERRRDIDRRRRRRKKIAKLRERLAKATSESEKRTLIDKILRISPKAPIE